MEALPHPPDAKHDKDSTEVLRGWIVEGELQISIAPWIWSEQPEEWGRLLAEAAGHMADAISKETGKDREELYDTIRKSIAYHLEHPLKTSGDFVDKATPQV